ncbi:permease-like cell division protein FtsX [Azospira sp.]|uniref:permease-like cell division protein FtsX n=1 Tax=Azospira sp. TaxID=1872671 RepID=UPI00256ACEB0|nr:permease-like cell division protein FtsX [Azospira sp.]MDK9690980.1 permease-like cell division protein FtsX [Azospira sp.]
MNAWLTQHLSALQGAWQRLAASPLNTVLSLLVIGIALTLPAAGVVVLDNLRQAAAGVASTQQISVFLSPEASRKEATEMESRLRQEVSGSIVFVPREDALKRLQGTAGMAELVASLPRNPLPDAFIVEPRNAAPEQLEALAKTLSAWPKVAHVQLDSAWIKRFDAFLRLGRLAVLLLAAAFAAALVAVTFNTIRLQILAQADEIEVAKLIGATDGFIRRPYYYFGALQGILGGLIAMLLVTAAVAVLSGPVSQLASLYATAFRLHGLGLDHSLLLLGVGALLGWLGAQLSVGLYLRQIEPK